MVIFTLFHGTDPHSVLLDAATKSGMHVYLGLPRAPATEAGDINLSYMSAYSEFIRRFLLDGSYRYSTPGESQRRSASGQHLTHHAAHPTVNATSLTGYFIGDEAYLFDVNRHVTSNYSHGNVSMLELYSAVGKLITSYNKSSMVLSNIDLRRRLNHTIESHVAGFESIVKSRAVDVVAVSEVRRVTTGRC